MPLRLLLLALPARQFHAWLLDVMLGSRRFASVSPLAFLLSFTSFSLNLLPPTCCCSDMLAFPFSWEQGVSRPERPEEHTYRNSSGGRESRSGLSNPHSSPCTWPGSGYQGTRADEETSSGSYPRMAHDRRKALCPCAHPKIGGWPELACSQEVFVQPDIFHLATRRQCQLPRGTSWALLQLGQDRLSLEHAGRSRAADPSSRPKPGEPVHSPH